MHDFRKLKVWEKLRELAKDVYLEVFSFPKEEMFGLTSQIKRSFISIPSNIAEGCGRDTNKQFKYHLNVALGSSFELETQLIISCDIKFISHSKLEVLIDKIQEINKMISGLKNKLI